MRKAVLNNGFLLLINRSYNHKNGFTNLKRMLQNFGTALSREQMKNVKGGCGPDELCGFADGGNAAYECQCVGVGRWTGNYPDQATAEADMNKYCANGGGCRAL